MLTGSCHCGQVQWSYSLNLESVTACNCTLCRRYGALWAYAHIHHGVEVSGTTGFYSRNNKNNNFHFCTRCGCLVYYVSNKVDSENRLRAAVNLRMIHEPQQIENLPIDHFEGLESFEDQPRDGRCVKDLWY